MADCPEAASIVGVYMHVGCSAPCRVCLVNLSAMHDKVGGFRNPEKISNLSLSSASDFLVSLEASRRKLF